MSIYIAKIEKEKKRIRFSKILITLSLLVTSYFVVQLFIDGVATYGAYVVIFSQVCVITSQVITIRSRAKTLKEHVSKSILSKELLVSSKSED